MYKFRTNVLRLFLKRTSIAVASNTFTEQMEILLVKASNITQKMENSVLQINNYLML